MSTKKGFTLLELTVVVSLILALVGIGLNAYSGARKAGRDARRKADLKTIQNSLELYYATCGLSYPTPATGAKYTSIICLAPSSAIMPVVPADPNITPYNCVGCGANSYQVCATLENETLPAPGYCVSNRQ